jgi:superfamily II DNA or RNA helicase
MRENAAGSDTAGDWFLQHATELSIRLPDSMAPASALQLRRAQVGAAWALAAHFTISGAPAVAVLPTGAGKTAVMTTLPLLIPTQRVLAVAPSRVVRDQLVDAFATLAVLRRVGALPEGGTSPRVRRVEHRLADAAAWEQAAEHADVVVGTVGCLSPALTGVGECPNGLFDLLVVDEAHHTPAQTWRALLESFTGVRAALFTATPFRRDRRELPADAVYTYRLGQALDDGILSTITFRPVPVVEGADHDGTIIAVARERLDAPEHVAAASLLLVRTDRLADGELLQQRYAEAGAPRVRHAQVHTKTGPPDHHRLRQQGSARRHFRRCTRRRV